MLSGYGAACEQIVFPAALIALSYFGAEIAVRLRIPTGRIVGPILLIAAIRIAGFEIQAPGYFRHLFSLILGVFFGLRFSRSALRRLASAAVPSVLTVLWYIPVTVLFGAILTRISRLDVITAFLAVVPGGMAEMNLIAMGYGAELAPVAAFQIARLVGIVMTVPLLVHRVLVPRIRVAPGASAVRPMAETQDGSGAPEAVAASGEQPWWPLFIAGGIGAIVLTLIRFPAGSMIGALIGAAALIIAKPDFEAAPPRRLFDFAQIGLGGLIGTSFTAAGFAVVLSLSVPIAAITAFMIVTSFVLAVIFSALFRWSLITSFLGVVPGGLSLMILMADELGADVVTVSLLQTVRLLTAIIAIPFLYTFFL